MPKFTNLYSTRFYSMLSAIMLSRAAQRELDKDPSADAEKGTGLK